jgi:hypothetical protein
MCYWVHRSFHLDPEGIIFSINYVYRFFGREQKQAGEWVGGWERSRVLGVLEYPNKHDADDIDIDVGARMEITKQVTKQGRGAGSMQHF